MSRDGGSMTSGRKAYMAYVAEGLGDLQDWNEVLTYQRKNGSLFNSPSTSAAVAIHNNNARALKYLDSLGKKFGGSGVPGGCCLVEHSMRMPLVVHLMSIVVCSSNGVSTEHIFPTLHGRHF